ncbi:MAG: PHP domain-containing protein [Candidatus Nealsonbacteria bacterium]|nr:PHP domain-containing protein [Candidatus Nealsonbacteria bacterium]
MTEDSSGRYPCDMHCHTLRSDGNDTPQELIAAAAKLGMHAVAITDHDIDPPRALTLTDGRQIDSVDYAARRGVRLILGYEFSCDAQVDDVHICGYGLDWEHPGLMAEVEAAKRSKSRAYEELCRRLTETGMPLDWHADILHHVDAAGSPAVRKPEEVQRKHIFEALAVRGYAPGWSEAKIMVRDDSKLNVRRRKIEPAAAVDLIHRCGGVAILAHPYLIDEVIESAGQPTRSRRQYIAALIDAGLDGIEASYSYDKTTYKGSLTPEQIEAEVRETYTNRVRFISGGSDYHADHKKGSKKVRRLGERGLTIDEFEDIFGN